MRASYLILQFVCGFPLKYVVRCIQSLENKDGQIFSRVDKGVTKFAYHTEVNAHFYINALLSSSHIDNKK